MRIRVTASLGPVRCGETVRPCFAHADCIYENMDIGQGFFFYKEEGKTRDLHAARAKLRGDKEQSGMAG